MTRPENTLPQKLLFVSITLLLAANLIVVSVSLASSQDLRIFRAAASTFRNYADATGKVLHASLLTVSQATRSTKKFVASVADFNTFIRPSSTMQTPVIAALYFPAAGQTARSAQTGSPIAAPAIAQAASAVQTPPSVQTAASALPQIREADLYAWGNCTWWVFIRRAQINDAIPASWGNAATWAERAVQDGYVVNHRPSPGAIMQIPGVDHGLGHVAFVESVDQDGTWHISEMNVLGLDAVDYKTEPAAAAVDYSFIHDKV